MPITIYVKRMVARAMYRRRIAFLRAAILLRQKGEDEYVVLHLICQGLEIVLKASLLFKGYDKYRPQLKLKFGHDLSRVVEAARAAFGFRKLPRPVANELNELSNFYKRHHLRYSGIADVFIDPTAIPSRLVMQRTKAVLRLFERSLKTDTGF